MTDGALVTLSTAAAEVAILIAYPSNTGLVNEAEEPAELVRTGPRGVMVDNFFFSDFPVSIKFDISESELGYRLLICG